MIFDAPPRRRARRRRRWYGVCILFALGFGAGLFLAVDGCGGSLGGPPPTSARPSREPLSNAKQRQQIAQVGSRFVIGDAGLVAPGLGWAMNGLDLWWTDNGGKNWRAIAPADVRATRNVLGHVVDVAAVDDSNIWLAVADVPGDQEVNGSTRHMEIERSQDGGKSWQSVIPPGCYGCGAAHLRFLDSQHGFALTKLGTQSRLYVTSDGGRQWQPRATDATFFGPIRFLSETEGWAASEEGAVYRTQDGGQYWRRIVLTAPSRYRGLPAAAGVPHFFGLRDGVVAVRFREHSRAQRVIVYITHDGGDSWSARLVPARVDLRPQSWPFPEAVPFSAATAKDWFLFVGSSLYTTHDGGQTWTMTRTVAPPAPHVWDVSFSSPRDGWAIFAVGNGAALVKTVDAGRHWAALAPHAR
jgi:photosystem II stability/assembly factor-like uncharacterized protein